ncbi:MAG: AcrR family transcriptional regulator [Myxococcota bacterium]|jgi:AcrR family transcriptional regulator
MSRAQSLPPDERRASLLSAARGVFAQNGYYSASVSLIVEEAGVARGTFYNHFVSKRAIFAVVIDDLMEEVASVIEIIDVAAPIAPQAVANIRRVILAVTAPEVARLLFTEAAGIDEEGDEMLRNFYRSATARIQTALERGQVLGIVRPGSVRLTAQCLLGMIKQPIFQASLEGSQVDADALVFEVFGMLAGGVLRVGAP